MASNFSIQSLHLLNLQVSQSPLPPSFSIFNFIPPCSSILPRFRVSIRPSLSIDKLHSLLLLSSSSSPLSYNSSTEHSFEVSYLIEKFGWTPKSAISRAKYLKFKTPRKPDRVLAFLKNHGLTETQISKFVWTWPQYLCCDIENTFLPKFAFLRSIGLSETEITRVVTKAPLLFKYSLEKRIVPAFNLILHLVKSNDEAVKIVKRYPMILYDSLDVDRIQILREVGVPEENIVTSTVYSYRGHLPAPDILRKTVEEVKEMGFDPGSMLFVFALRTIGSLSKSTWEGKVQVLKKYGWSDREVLLAFRNDPKFINTSKNKIDGIMDFLINRMGVEATTIANYSTIFSFSLKKRIVPRFLVYQKLLEKGLWKKKLSIPTFCWYTENEFVSNVIKHYENEAPELWDLYNELLDLGKDIPKKTNKESEIDLPN